MTIFVVRGLAAIGGPLTWRRDLDDVGRIGGQGPPDMAVGKAPDVPMWMGQLTSEVR